MKLGKRSALIALMMLLVAASAGCESTQDGDTTRTDTELVDTCDEGANCYITDSSEGDGDDVDALNDVASDASPDTIEDAASPDATSPDVVADTVTDVAEAIPCPDGASPAIVAVAGDLTHQATLRIDGCRFGIKAQAAPRLHDTVDNQLAYASLTVGDRIPTEADDAPWSDNHDSWRNFVRLADEDPRAHRTAFYRVSGGVHGGDGALGWPRALGANQPPADQRVLYATSWYRPSMDPGGGDPVGSNKFIRIWDDSSGDGTRISWTHMHIGYSGTELTGWRSWTEDGHIGQWNRMEITVDADQGTIRHYVNGVYQKVSNSSVGTYDIDNFVKDPAYADVGLSVGTLGFDHGLTSYAEMVSDFGEVYLDTTRARVEIGDAPTWAQTRHREIQIPFAWSDDVIEVHLQEGSFEGLSGRYLYVIDAEGNVNEQGFAL